MSPALAPVQQPLTHADLIDSELWDRLTNRIMGDEDISRPEAESILDAALGYLQMCADHPERRFTPSSLVDIGWHTFILYTKSYTKFCQKIGGGYIHHEPNDIPGRPQTVGNAATTIAFMREHGIQFNELMWPAASANCTVDCDGGRGGSGTGGGFGGCS